ncbi:AMP-binding protein [Nocardioides sediminis]|uniref:AMP-binding protein n=1 Tax=Nocardioides sediminis TaxID=433648 RepID=UPI000D302252|nr:AMP-binding protein [Nocardioides sediminis]
MDQGEGGTADVSPTLARLLWERSEAQPDDVAYRHLVGAPGREAWQDVTWSEVRALVEPLAAGLVGLGVEPGDRVAVLSRIRVDWVLAHLAGLCAGAATVAVPPDSAPEDLARVVHDAGAVVVVAEDVEQVDKLRRVRGDIRSVRKVVLFDGQYPDRRVMTWEELLGAGEELLADDPAAVVSRVEALPPAALATVLPAAGAEGPAEPVRVTHRAWVHEGLADLPTGGPPGPGDGLRPLPPLTRSGSHALLASQLAHGFGAQVEAGRDAPAG